MQSHSFQSQTRSQSPGDLSVGGNEPSRLDVSIADAKPIPWRRAITSIGGSTNATFQSQTRSQSPGDMGIDSIVLAQTMSFQSQTRSQSPGDSITPLAM